MSCAASAYRLARWVCLLGLTAGACTAGSGDPGGDLDASTRSPSSDLGPGTPVDRGGGPITPALMAPASFGPGFVDLSAVLDGRPSDFLSVPRPATDTGDPHPTIGFFGDVDGDGRDEVILAPTLDSPAGRTAVAYDYDAAAGRITLRGRLNTAQGNDRLYPMGLRDLDGDGFVDLILNRPEQEVAWGLGGGRFEAPSAMVRVTGVWAPNFPSIALIDFDGDGWLDVVFGSADCCTTCRGMKLYLRTAPRTFADRTELFDDAPPGYSYALLSGTLNGTPLLMNIGGGCGGQDAPSFYRLRATDPAGYPRFEPFDPIPPDAFIRTFEGDVRLNATRPLSHWVPMGVAVGDADGDSVLDLAVSLNFYLGLFPNPGRFPLEDRTAPFGNNPSMSDMGRRMIPWGVALVDFDQDGRNDLVGTHGNDHSAFSDPAFFVGPQHCTLHWNAGGSNFVEVGSRLHIDQRGQWRSLDVDDFDRDGDADFIIGSHEDNPRVFRNDIARGNHGFSMRFRGTTSNALGVGAEVSVLAQPGLAAQLHQVGSVGSPLLAAAPTVFVGLGAATSAATVRVRWPSGVVQELHDVAAGTLHVVEEPPLLALTPASRHLPADGRSTATLLVTPRQPDGSVRMGATVTARVAHGGGTAAAPRWNGSAWEVTITAPATAGSSVVEVQVDGVAVGVRPRLWWD